MDEDSSELQGTGPGRPEPGRPEPGRPEPGAASSGGASSAEAYFTADRAKAFVDGVVAIAMTLLIIPLLEAITGLVSHDSAGHQNPVPSAAAWFGDNFMLLITFLISFAVIAMFWINHHRLFAGVRRVSVALLWLNMVWLLTIVWLPVATAMTGVMHSNDPGVLIAYMGTMVLTSLAALVQVIYLRRHPALHEMSDSTIVGTMAVNCAMAVLFAISLVIAILLPDQVSYFALFLLVLTGTVRALFVRILGARRSR